MKALLLNPPYNYKTYTGIRIGASVQPPLGLAYIAGTLESNDIEVEIFDSNALTLSIDETVNRVSKIKFDILGITATTTSIPLVFSISEKLKKSRPDILIVVGGVHVTYMDIATLEQCSSIDILIRGEGEMTFLELMQGKKLSDIEGITYREKGKIRRNKDRDIIKNIDEISFPARHLLPIDLYRPGVFYNIGFEGRKYTSFITSRGCPNKCTYCSSAHFWRILRLRSPENVIKEIEGLVDEFGTKNISFFDDTFTFARSRTEKICDMMIEKELDIKWNCFARVNTVDRELIKKMKKAGCYGVDFGVESGDEEVLKRIKKNITIQQVKDAIELTKRENMITVANFMVGLPGDTYDTVKKTINLAKEVNPDIAFFSITTPFPGTELYHEAKEKKWIEGSECWDDMILHGETKFHNDSLNSSEIHKLYGKAHKDFYLRPGFFMHSLKRLLKNPKHLKRYLIGGIYIFTE